MGLLIGFFFFGSTVERFWSFWNSAGALGRLTLPDWLGVSPGIVVFAIVLMALTMFWAAEKIERAFTARRNEVK